MIYFLIIRTVPLLLRPLAVFAESFFFEGSTLSVLVAAAGGMGLALSSIPVHMPVYQTLVSDPDFSRQRNRYLSAMALLTVAGGILTVLAALFIDSATGAAVLAVVVFAYLVERATDEIARYLEFRKQFFRWFIVQIIRSGWLLVAMAVTMLGIGYESAALMLVVALAAAYIIVLWKALSGARINLTAGFDLLRSSVVYVPTAVLLGLARQLPRMFIARSFPELAHMFLIISQFTQGVSILYNVKFLMPWRKLIARKPRQFEAKISALHRRAVLCLSFCLIGILAVVPFVPGASPDHLGTYAVMGAICLMDAVLLAVLGAYLEFTVWLREPEAVFRSYCLMLAFYLCGGLAIWLLSVFVSMSIYAVLLLFALYLAGSVWLVFRRHFDVRAA